MNDGSRPVQSDGLRGFGVRVGTRGSRESGLSSTSSRAAGFRKRSAIAIVAVLALLAVASCSGRVSSDGDASSDGGGTTSTTGAPKAPITVGLVGDWSSVVGAAVVPARDAVQAWAEMVNERGGLGGHPVNLLVGDDGGDGAKSMELVQDFVENKGAVALVSYFGAAVTTIATYAEQHNVPLIGGLPDPSWFDSWAAFPTQPPSGPYGYAMAKIAVDNGADKAAVVYCAESPLCKSAAQPFLDNAPEVGLDVSYEASIGFVQPDFTAECLQAKDSGAQMFLPIIDGNGITRISQSCDRQDYAPTYITLSPATDQSGEPELDGMIAVLRDFPWFLTSGSPALEEYGEATADLKTQFQTSIGWSAAKLLEKAASELSDTPTSDDLFKVLWSLQDETLGGLTPALTFREKQPPTPANCAFVAKVVDGKWTAPNGMDLTGCEPES